MLVAACALFGLGCGQSDGPGADAGPVEASADASAGDRDQLAPSDGGGTDQQQQSDSSDAGAAPSCRPCPASPSVMGSDCDPTNGGQYCEYGDDPRFVNTLEECSDGAWWVSQAGVSTDAGVSGTGCPSTYEAAEHANTCPATACDYAEGSCVCRPTTDPLLAGLSDAGTYWSCLDALLPPGCPGSLAEAQEGADAAACPPSGQFCYYPHGTCTCFMPDSGPQWSCVVPDAGCPTTRPRLGTACDLPSSVSCQYLPLNCGFPMGPLRCVADACDGGVWASDEEPRCH